MRFFRLTLMKTKAIIGGVLPLLAAVLLVSVLSFTVRRTLLAQTAGAISLAVVDEDQSALSEALIDALSGGGALDVAATDAGGARRLVLRGRAEGILTIPVGYAEAVKNGVEALLTYKAAPFSASSDAAREIIAAEAVMQQSSERAKSEAVSRNLIEEGDFSAFDARFAENRGDTAGLVLFTSTGTGEAGGALFLDAGRRYAGSAGLLLMLLILSLAQFLSLPDTRLVNARLRAFPHGRATAFLSDNAALCLLSFLLAGACVPFALGRLCVFLAAALLYAFAVAGLSSLLSSVSADAGGTDALAPFIVLITSLVGGCFFDASSVSELLGHAARFTPQGLLMEAAGGSGAALVALCLFGALCFALSYFAGKKRGI